MRGHRLRVLERAAIAEIGGDSGGAEGVISDRPVNAERNRAPTDHAPGVGLGHWSVEKRHGVVAWAGSKEPAFAIVRNAGSVDVSPQYLRGRMMTGHCVLLAALLVKLHLPACALWPKILHLHAQRRGDPSEGIGEGGDERAVAQGRARFRLECSR